MANFIVDFLFGPKEEEITFGAKKGDVIRDYGRGEKGALAGFLDANRYAEMTDEEYEAAIQQKLAENQLNRPITDENGYGEPMAALALDRGLPMYQPAGPNQTFTQEQYLQTLAQQPITNKLFTPEEDAAARQQFAQQMSAFKNRMAGFNKLYPNVNAMTRSPNVNTMYNNPAYDALVFGQANNPAPFSAGPSQGEVNPPSSRFQARRIGR